jgi:hypothetical protein
MYDFLSLPRHYMNKRRMGTLHCSIHRLTGYVVHVQKEKEKL